MQGIHVENIYREYIANKLGDSGGSWFEKVLVTGI
jgi:hypothetical protein